MNNNNSYVKNYILKLYRLIYYDEEINEHNINNFNDVYTRLEKEYDLEKAIIFSLYEIDEVEQFDENTFKTNNGLLEITKYNDKNVYILSNFNCICVNLNSNYIYYEKNDKIILNIENYKKLENTRYFIQEKIDYVNNIYDSICHYLDVNDFQIESNDNKNVLNNGDIIINFPFEKTQEKDNQIITSFNMNTADFYVFDFSNLCVNIFIYEIDNNNGK